MYVQDYDESLLPSDYGPLTGLPSFTHYAWVPFGASSGGAGIGPLCCFDLLQPYQKNTQINTCPSDGTGQPSVAGNVIPGKPLSYGLNQYFYNTPSGFRHWGGTLAEIARPA